MRFVAMPLLLTAPLCRRKSSLCFAVAPLSTAAASLLISSPFAFRREAAPGRCFSPLLYALPLPRLALRYSALAFPSISIHCLSCSVHFCATALHCRAFPLLHFAMPCHAFACPRFSLQHLCSSKLRLAFSALSFALPLQRESVHCLCISRLIYTLPLPFAAFLRLHFADADALRIQH